MGEFVPRAICYHGTPDEIAGWICGNDFCLTVYLTEVVGDDAESMATYCCDHPCWKCGAKTVQGYVLCALCRAKGHARVHRLPPTGTRITTTTLTAPEGSIGAIGAPDTSSDDSAVVP